MDPFGEQENEETYDQLNSKLFSSDAETINLKAKIWPDFERVGFGNSAVPVFADNMINENVGLLNDKQRHVLYISSSSII